MFRLGRGTHSGGRPLRAGAAMWLAMLGVLGVFPAARASSAAGPAWTKQAPLAHPPGRDSAAMAYDAAAGTVVLFGGEGSFGAPLGDTWTWNDTAWAQQHPASSPPARWDAAMAYDAAAGHLVLFGGIEANGQDQDLSDTWTWNGSTWTQQHPASHPPALWAGAMAYDAATSHVVLFGGIHGVSSNTLQSATWTWNGSTWTRQHPASHPSARYGDTMAYDAATGTVVLFGGAGASGSDRPLADTWIWG
jgi:hypothetical protein